MSGEVGDDGPRQSLTGTFDRAVLRVCARHRAGEAGVGQ
jgi:hypothetical protein